MREVQPTFIARSTPYREPNGKTICDRCGIEYSRTKIQCQECFDNRHCGDCRSLTHSEHSQPASAEALPETCDYGHEYTPENTGTRTRGNKTGRYCKACKQAENRRYYTDNKDAA